MTATVGLGTSTVGAATFSGRSTATQQIVEQIGTAESVSLSIARTGTGRVYYTARLNYLAPEPRAIDRGFRVQRQYELFVPNGRAPPRPRSSTPAI
jgi:hypothetical protein